MRTLTRFLAAVVTAVVVPACSVIASSGAHADPVATTATVLRVVDGDTVDIVDDVRGRLRIRLFG
jgi:micrococcal nuclease